MSDTPKQWLSQGVGCVAFYWVYLTLCDWMEITPWRVDAYGAGLATTALIWLLVRKVTRGR
jgi:hypothetical protein